MESPMDAFALFHELADRSPAEREAYYAARDVPATVRADVVGWAPCMKPNRKSLIVLWR
jgi:hypothetical protein